jgi:metallo-beta-lactamase family protein
MKVKFCGAARTVTGSAHLLTLDNGYTVLLDCGLYQGRDEEFEDFNANWQFDPATLDCLVLSHAHIDHCGRIPKLVKDGFRGEIICTSATRDLCAIMLMDSAKIQVKDAEYLNRRNSKKGLPETAKPLYTTEDAFDCFKKFVGIGYEKWHKINEDVSVYLRDCGHIFGSSNVTLKIKENGKETHLGFSGDIGRSNRPILKDPVQMEDLDYLICESTYGGRLHNDLPHDEDALLNVIFNTCVKKKGKLIIPAFSLGRTQEIVYMLDKLENSGLLPSIPVFVDSPLAVNATDIFRIHPECFDNEIIEYMIDDPNPFGFNNLKYTRKVSESKSLNDMEGPAIIISASGMMTGGRIMHHLINHIEDQRNTLLIVGFCAPHTTGARIRNGEKKIRVFGQKLYVNAKVEVMDSYSGHGDQQEMIDFLSNLDRKKLKNIFLVHGELDSQQAFKSVLEVNKFSGIEIPGLGQEFNLN